MKDMGIPVLFMSKHSEMLPEGMTGALGVRGRIPDRIPPGLILAPRR